MKETDELIQIEVLLDESCITDETSDLFTKSDSVTMKEGDIYRNVLSYRL